ncbi:MAG: hypothetical protein HY749_22295 [Gammaproteobacteria bacterium]|nr:hypothetical protein [Gammaproteobacteria bacterium]
MRASAPFFHRRRPRAALQVAPDEFVALQTGQRSDLGLPDVITGDLAKSDIEWCLNMTRDTLVQIGRPGRFATLRAAMDAVTGADAPRLKLIVTDRNGV